MLSEEQQDALAFLGSKNNVYLTGVAGTGKTRVLRDYLEELPPGVRVAVTASTGIAALHIGGTTLHKWAGIGLGEEPADVITDSGFWRKQKKWEIRRTSVLVVDEISMIDAYTLDLVEQVCRIARENDAPFGGIQVCLVGDMGQLPPVKAGARGFPFQADSWRRAKPRVIELTKVFRQQDQKFADILREVRDGKLSDENMKILQARSNAYDPEKTSCVRLMTHNVDVDEINERQLGLLPLPEMKYVARDSGPEHARKWLEENCLAPTELRLRKGARIMFVKNSELWANGTLGEVVDMNTDTLGVKLELSGQVVTVERAEWKVRRTAVRDGEAPEDVAATRAQFPVRLAWAITVHKSQGMTIDRVSTHLGKSFAAGQVYVAFSRSRSLEGLNIESWPGRSNIRQHPLVTKFLAGEEVPRPRRADVEPENA